MTVLENFLKTKKVQKALNTKPGEEGFSLVELVVVIAVLAILSAVAVPAFVGVQANARASAVKNGLVNGVKECVVRDADNQTTAYADVQSFKGSYSGYTLAQDASAQGDSCYSAKATPATSKATQEAEFYISLNSSTGEVSKTCKNPSKVIAPGCPSTELW
tara:strand:+ start:604 stop:1086 length:483 start_codon:yes stop_codon:yes gene_type:complete